MKLDRIGCDFILILGLIIKVKFFYDEVPMYCKKMIIHKADQSYRVSSGPLSFIILSDRGF